MKKLNIKAFFVNHTEKLIFGLIGFIVLLVLGNTTRTGSPKSAGEIKSKVKAVKDRINDEGVVWADRSKFKAIDFSDKAKKLLVPFATEKYLFSAPIYHPLNRVNEPRREPIYEPVQQLMAMASLVTLSVHPDGSSQNTATATQSAVNLGAANNVGNANRNPGQNDVAAQATANPANAAQAAAKGAPAAPIGHPARGYPVVAVRGLFPVKKQIENYMKALHESEIEAKNDLEIWDFVLERQIAKEGPNPWKDNEWRPVSIESLKDVLQEFDGNDLNDKIPLDAQDVVITFPLPKMLVGEWGELATHPKLKDQLLSGDELDLQNKRLSELEEKANEAKPAEVEKKGRRGLAAFQTDLKALNQPGKAGANSAPSPQSRNNLQIQTPEKNAAISLDYYLFRYLDFEVVPGLAYRYRVKLTLRNPNHQIAPEKLGGADPNIANGAERPTPWSNVSDVAVVPRTVEYFLENVGKDPYRDPKGKPSSTYPPAEVSIFNWDTKYGTYVTSKSLKIANIGSYIGDDKIEDEGKRKPRNNGTTPSKAELAYEHPILDLTIPGVVTKKYYFSTQDLLLDVEPDTEIEMEQHPDLKFAGDKKPGGISHLNLVESVLVCTSLGELKTLDTKNHNSEKDRLNARVQKERATFSNPVAATGDSTRGDANQPRQINLRRFNGPPVRR